MSPNLKLVVWGALAVMFGVSSNALHFPSNALSLAASENKVKIELIDVKCDKNENGMQVNVVFSEPFDGIIYSQGFFNDPKCRYVSAGENEKSHNFVVPFEGCGSKPSCSICDSIDNILIIQQDEEVQGEFDAARKISCSRTGLEDQKKIFFKPFIVEMLDVVTVPTANGGVDCWMDIQRGIFPKLTALGDSIKIGEALSVLVYLRDPRNEYDLTVRNCWAYDSENFDDKNTGKVQLSDAAGCTMKRKLLGTWRKTNSTGTSGASLLLHNTLRAFKFPDEAQVYLKCDIEICRGTCAEAICDADEIHKVDCTVDPFNPKCIDERLNEDRVESTTQPLGFSTLPYKSYQTTRVPNSFTVTTKRPPFGTSATERFGDLLTTTIIDEQETTTQTAFGFVCGQGSRDIRCRRLQNLETTQLPETTTFRETTTLQETTTIPSSVQSNTISWATGFDSFCQRYPNNKRCSQRITEDLGPNVEILTFRPPSPFATVQTTTDTPTTNLPSTTFIPKLSPFCARNSNDHRCRQNEIIHTTAASQVDEQSFNCRGNNLDPRCPNPTPTNTPPTYLPPSTTQKVIIPKIETSSFPTISTTKQSITRQPITRQPITQRPTTEQPITQNTAKKFFICVPGSNDVNCDFEANKSEEEPAVKEQTLEKKTTPIPSRNQYTTKKPDEKLICSDQSTDPECQNVSTNIITSKPKLSTIKPPTAFTSRTNKKPLSTTTNRYVASEIPVFVIQECYPGSPDPSCSTTKKPVPKATTVRTTARPASSTTQKTVYKVPSTTRQPICHPGSSNERCLGLITTKIGTTQESTTELLTTTTVVIESSSTIASQCNLGSKDPRCTNAAVETTPENSPEITSTIGTSTIISETTKSPTTAKPKISPQFSIKTNVQPTRPPVCYPGSLDPQCKPNTKKPTFTPFKTITIKSLETTPPAKQTSTENSAPEVISTTAAPRCYPGALDARCLTKSTTSARITASISPGQEASEIPNSTTLKPVPSKNIVPPQCYPGSRNPICRQFSTTTQRTSSSDSISKQATIPMKSESIPSCYPGSLDARCLTKSTTPARITASVSPSQEVSEIPTSTTLKPVPSKNIVPPQCYPGSRNPICRQFSTTTQRTSSIDLISKLATIPIKSESIPSCYPGSLDPQCASQTKCGPGITPLDPRCPNPTPTAEPPQYLPPIATDKAASQVACAPNSLDPQCKSTSTTESTPNVHTEEGTTSTYIPKVITKSPPISVIPTTSRPSVPLIRFTPPTTTKKPTSTTSAFSTTTTTNRPFTTFVTRRIISSPQPFVTRSPPVSTTTENILCYPGSPIEGCKPSDVVTPSYCYPGSKDKRCPQLPPSFSTREPATYLPPFPDTKHNRVKRAPIHNHETNEIVKFSLSFKPFSI